MGPRAETGISFSRFDAVRSTCARSIVLAAATIVATYAGAQAEKPNARTEYCTNATCHAGILDRAFVHGPETQVQCTTCHEYASADQHLFRLTVPKAQVCTTCHVLEHESVFHTPVAQGDCAGCHDPHGSNNQMMLVKEPTKGLCLECHDRTLVENEYVHGPVAVEACVLCHDPHSSPNVSVLTVSPERLCFECHSEMEAKGVDARHLHKPMEDGCTSCHDPHSSSHKFQLQSSSPTLCYTCHEGVQKDVAAAIVKHEPVEKEGGCAECHNPHFTPLPSLEKAPQPELCLKCHNKQLPSAAGSSVSDMATLLEENPNHHGPIRDGSCTACHHPHAADHYRLLSKEYPAEFYAPYSPERYELCFTCHIADLVKDEAGTGLTNFRDGNLNLHWLHVNQEKGRTCRACHEVHASKRPFHVREAVPFGSAGWMLDINFQKNDQGGTCLPGCHKEHNYDRSSARGITTSSASGSAAGE